MCVYDVTEPQVQVQQLKVFFPPKTFSFIKTLYAGFQLLFQYRFQWFNILFRQTYCIHTSVYVLYIYIHTHTQICIYLLLYLCITFKEVINIRRPVCELCMKSVGGCLWGHTPPVCYRFKLLGIICLSNHLCVLTHTSVLTSRYVF